MKIKRCFLLNKYKKPDKFKYRNFLISLLLCLFPLNCTFNNTLVYKDLFMYFPFSSKNLIFELEEINSTRRIVLPKLETDLNVLSYNLFLYPREDIYFGFWKEKERAEFLGKSKFIKNQDIIVLGRAFDTNARNTLLNNLNLEYPDQTEVIGKTKYGWDQTLGDFRQQINNGGIVILSKWPIQEKIQYIFKNHGCGNDTLYNKGFAYVKIKKENQIIHIIGTDTQSEDSACSDLGVNARTDQLIEIKKFIDSKRISNKEIVLIAGSLNVNKSNQFEYKNMLKILEVNEPNYAGIHFTWDTQKNKIAAYNNVYYSWNRTSNYGEYIFVSKNHFQLPVWQNLAYDPISPTTWKRENGYTSYEFSDHFPVYGFIYADSSTPTKSGHRRKYDQVSLIAKYTGKAVQVDHNRPDGWLKADGTAEEKGTEFTKFNLLQEYDPDSDTFCMLGGRVRVESSQYLNYFWTWWLRGGAGNYAYYPKFDDGSKLLEMIVIRQGCLEDESLVVFKDFDTFWKYYYFLAVWETGSWKDYIYLWYTNAQPNSYFIVKLNTLPERDWSKDLIYR
ncbi:sphingomyelin phosphodiesterase [Leptospira kirschneri]|uniref:sphingomyelin phosphodiesterase n=1 Tax=Leptospira kirschneri TaxID=29507 RepID=UPI000519B0B9|nr:sphingomyelin phosphodiesterase [Leptospira kirschneri]